MGSRLTRTDTETRISRKLFAAQAGIATWIDATGSGEPIVYQFVADPVWARVVYSEKDEWIEGYNNTGGVGGALISPRQIAISGKRELFIPDPNKGRVIVANFNGTALSPAWTFNSGLSRPVAVAWDGRSDPLNTTYVYVLDEVTSQVSYRRLNLGTWVTDWSYGSVGSGTGQFDAPNGLCVGHSAASNGGSVFTSNFYVTDPGNNRVVWLQRTSTGAIWKGVRNLPNSGVPSDCTVDHYGKVYVADLVNGRILKYTSNLGTELGRYGSPGTGETSLNTFWNPRAIEVPFGKGLGSSGQTVWYGEGRILTAEDWSPASGGLEHWLGVRVNNTSSDVSGGFASATFLLTDHTLLTVYVVKVGGTAVRQLFFQSLRPSGWNTVTWDGTKDDGTPAETGTYRFSITARSTYCVSEAWCNHSRNSPNFSWSECVQDEGGGGGGGPALSRAAGVPRPNFDVWQPPPCETANPGRTGVAGDVTVTRGIPSEFRLGQMIGSHPGPLLRLEGSASATASVRGSMTDAEAVAIVKASGIRTLRIEVPAQSGTFAQSVRVDIHSLTGRRVKTLLSDRLDPGYYAMGWDARDEMGREVPPGVYIAVMTAGEFRGVQRLIIK